MANTFIVNQITHEMRTFKFNTLDLLLEFISKLDIPEWAKDTLYEKNHVSVQSKNRVNCLDTFVINVYNDYFDDYNNSLDSRNKELEEISKSITMLDKKFDNELVITEQRVQVIMLQVYLALIYSVLDDKNVPIEKYVEIPSIFAENLRVRLENSGEYEMFKKVFGELVYA